MQTTKDTMGAILKYIFAEDQKRNPMSPRKAAKMFRKIKRLLKKKRRARVSNTKIQQKENIEK